ncbi:alpha/beta fold hydrolase [Halomonas sp. ZH2S]|uniref:Alpha/beta fold hydrolase n=1 Tax=Vreelandella zhuhanensis TaxID=2684210 RepID=A0A7X3GXZ4_9GAMM|nr:alpha/beta hydrolase [Halomonas zhuhanensis]MWJ26958.1 alpha/beta fold hydrolase [Halomonas zhuhanensis]
MKRLFSIPVVMVTITLAGCLSQIARQHPGPGTEKARMEKQQVIAEDGYRLPLHHWPDEDLSNKWQTEKNRAGEAKTQPRAVVLGIHGFNDHGGSFSILADALTPHGIEVYAYDQRGFGATRQRGIWPGHRRLVDDATLVAELLRKRHPDAPLYLVGESMGAAVTILALSRDDAPPVAGSVLIAPAVWGWEAMPWYQRLGLWLGVRLFPSMRFSGDWVRNLGIEPTDDPEIKRKLAEDPLILRHARVDTLHGLTHTMDKALKRASDLPPPALILYGDADDIIPPQAICALLAQLPERDGFRIAFYPEGYHMLTRYTQRERTEMDMLAWLLNPEASLPSGHEVTQDEAYQALCEN